MSPSALRFTEHEPVPGPVSLVLSVIAFHPSGGGLDGRPHIPEQLLGTLVKTHHRTLWVVGFVVKSLPRTGYGVQHVLHPGHELPAQLGDAPFLLLPRLEFVFLSIWRTVSKEMLPANSISTTLSASRWSVQLTCPSGGLLHATATRCASCLPFSLRSRPSRAGLAYLLLAGLVQADQDFLVIGAMIDLQHVLHSLPRTGYGGAHELGAALGRDAPAFLQPRLQFVFFKVPRTVSALTLSTISHSTNRSAKSLRVQSARPSGGSEQARATR